MPPESRLPARELCAKPSLAARPGSGFPIHQQIAVTGFDHGLVGIAEESNIDRLTEDPRNASEVILPRGTTFRCPRKDIVSQLMGINSWAIPTVWPSNSITIAWSISGGCLAVPFHHDSVDYWPTFCRTCVR